MDSFTEVVRLLDKDIHYRASTVTIANFTHEDLVQELTFQIWRKIHLFSPWKGYSIRTWAAQVMDSRIKDMIAQSRRPAREIYVNKHILPYDELTSDARILTVDGSYPHYQPDSERQLDDQSAQTEV